MALVPISSCTKSRLVLICAHRTDPTPHSNMQTLPDRSTYTVAGRGNISRAMAHHMPRPSAAQSTATIRRTCAHLLDVSAPAEPAGAEDTARMRVHLPTPHCTWTRCLEPTSGCTRLKGATAIGRPTSSSAINSRFAPRTSVTICTTCARRAPLKRARDCRDRRAVGWASEVWRVGFTAEEARHTCDGGQSCGEILAGYRRYRVCVRLRRACNSVA